VNERTIATTIHGRYLLAPPATPGAGAPPLLVGFHGYAEPVARQFERQRALPGTSEWAHCAVQGLHRFYQKGSGDAGDVVVASWMTRQDRDLAIADNLRYVAAVVDEVRGELGSGPLVFIGFSQGVAMTFRAGAHIPCQGVIALCGDVPPELAEREPLVLPPVLLATGSADDWYTEPRLVHDLALLRERGVPVEPFLFDGGHRWTDAFADAASRFLARIREGSRC
jgi:predicted esterase